MVTNKEQALEGLRNGEITLADISIDLRSDEEIAITAIKEYGESAIAFLISTESLPHTPEIFMTILENTKSNVADKISNTPKVTVKDFDNEEDIDKLLEYYSELSTDLANINTAIEVLEKQIKDKIPEKGGQEH